MATVDGGEFVRLTPGSAADADAFTMAVQVLYGNLSGSTDVQLLFDSCLEVG